MAIKDAIDPGDAHDAAVAKVEAVAGTGEDQVPAKELAKWITDNAVSSEGLSKSDYVVASVNLGTSKPIVEENAEMGGKGNTEIAFTEVEAATSDGFTFDFELKIDGTAESLELAQEYVAGCIQTTGDLGTGFEVIGDPDRVTIDPETGKVTIKPDPTKPAEFFKIVIPKDPGAK